jgi:DNA-directed RNA polymerase specialized sigma subunit
MQQNQIIEWRRARVIELLSKDETNQSEIVSILQVNKSTVCRDIAYTTNKIANVTEDE